jgi:hypothetical protein
MEQQENWIAGHDAGQADVTAALVAQGRGSFPVKWWREDARLPADAALRVEWLNGYVVGVRKALDAYGPVEVPQS